jgi:Fe-Mn family superoxide dismutase
MELPFDPSSLEPYISAETISYHYGKHHATYVAKLNTLIEGTEYADMSLVTIIRQSDGAVFNNAAQVYNHDFYWKGLLNSTTEASVELLRLIERDFKSIDAFKESFMMMATAFFGSGWIWLVLSKEGKLVLQATSNADTPIRNGDTPLLTCDVWEHAYYIDYRNGRANYLENWWKLINWEFVSENLKH